MTANIVLRMGFLQNSRVAPTFRYDMPRGQVPCARSRSLNLEACALDHLLPLLGLGDNILAELLRRLDQRCTAELDQAGLDRGLGEDRIHFGVELGDDLLRRVLWRAHARSEEHTSELQSRGHLVCRLLLEKKKKTKTKHKHKIKKTSKQ